MPLILAGLAGLGFGSFFGSQADDAFETLTGERGGIPYLQIAILIVVGWLIWRRVG